MPSNDFIVHPRAEVQGESASTTGVLLSLTKVKEPCSLPWAGESSF